MSSSTPSPSTSVPVSKDSLEPPAVGDVIDAKYTVERVLGSGGMGVVVEARHALLGELVAIKFLRADARSRQSYGDRFLREAKATLRIKSEHVVRIHDMGIAPGGHPYIVMEHLAGRDLASVLRDDGALSVQDSVDYVLQACSGLAEAHAQGVVHRDLKPANLFLARRADGTAILKILDFGIAKARADVAVSITDTGATFGSPGYMSPEQIRSSKDVDERSDVWSLGVVLFELLTRQLPFTGSSGTAVIASVIADAPRSVRSLRPDVPSEIAAVIERCLAKAPDHRFASAYELASALRPFAGDSATASAEIERMRRLATSTSAPPPRPSLPSRAAATELLHDSPRATARRQRMMAGGVAILVAGVTAIVAHQWRTASSSPVAVAPWTEAPSAATLTSVSPEPRPALSPAESAIVAPPAGALASGPSALEHKASKRGAKDAGPRNAQATPSPNASATTPASAPPAEGLPFPIRK